MPLEQLESDTATLVGVASGGGARVVRPRYYGFTINQKLATKPAVGYTLQPSKDNHPTWQEFVSDADWTVGLTEGTPI